MHNNRNPIIVVLLLLIRKRPLCIFCAQERPSSIYSPKYNTHRSRPNAYPTN